MNTKTIAITVYRVLPYPVIHVQKNDVLSVSLCMHIYTKFTKTKISNFYQRLYYIHVRVFQTSNAIDVIAAQLIHKAIMASRYTDRNEYRSALLCSWNNTYIFIVFLHLYTVQVCC